MKKSVVVAMAALSVWAVPSYGQTFFTGRNFAGTNRAASGFIPPDTMGAVGRDHYVELINGRYATYRKSDGARVQDVSLNSFFSSAGVAPTSFAFDPRILYDPFSDRWFALAVDNSRQANRFLLAVSISSDPTAGWRGFGIDTDTDNNRWADFPTLGMNGTNVVISANMFGVAGASTTTAIAVVNKAGLLTTTPATAAVTLFEDIDPNTTGFTPHPVWDIDNNTGTSQNLSQFNSSFQRMTAVSGTGGSASLSISATIGVTALGQPPTADQPGTKANINTGSDRFSGSVIRNGNDIWAVQCIDVGGRASLRWFRYNATTLALVASGTISDASLALFYPSIAVNDFGDIVIGCSTTSPTQNVSASMIVGTYTANSVAFGAIQNYQVGLSDYEVLDGSGRNRWGDYSATNVDPADPSIFWSIQEYVSATDQWATRVGEFIIPRAGEVRWAPSASGSFSTASNWFGGAVPSATSRLVFSRSTTPGGAGYTVTLPAGTTTAASLRVHQGTVNLNLGGGTLNLTDAASTVIVGEYAGSPQATVSNGTLVAAQIFVGTSALSRNASLTLSGTTQVADIGVGGTVVSAGAAASLISAGATTATGTVQVWPGSTLTVSAGTLQIGNGGTTGTLIGNVVSNSVLAFNRSDAVNFLGAVSGTGGVSQLGSGTTTLTGALTYTGATSATAGRLVLRSALSTTSGDAVVGANGALDFGLARTGTPVVVSQLDNLSVAAGGVARVTVTDRGAGLAQGVLVVNSISLTGTGFVDLTNNDMIVRGQSVAAVRALVGAWYTGNSGLPGTSGLGSSEAFYTDAGAFTTLAVYDNSVAGQTLGTFEGVAVLPTDVLVKYTYLGDTNLDGLVDATDLTRVLQGLNGQGTGWNFGDVNYDGVVNFVDLGRTQAALRGQGAPLGGSLGGGGVIPEPSAVGAILGVSLLAGRRRRS